MTALSILALSAGTVYPALAIILAFRTIQPYIKPIGIVEGVISVMFLVLKSIQVSAVIVILGKWGCYGWRIEKRVLDRPFRLHRDLAVPGQRIGKQVVDRPFQMCECGA